MYLSIENIDDLITKAFFSQRGTKSAAVYPIKKGSELIALIGFEWTHTSEDFSNKLSKIQDDVKTMGGTLSKLL